MINTPKTRPVAASRAHQGSAVGFRDRFFSSAGMKEPQSLPGNMTYRSHPTSSPTLNPAALLSTFVSRASHPTLKPKA